MNARRTGGIAIGIVALAVYWRTAYPTINWWDSSNYSLAAHTMGVASPPGSLLLTLAGAPFAHLPFASPARILNLLAALLAAGAAIGVFLVALRLFAVTRLPQTPGAIAGAAMGALTFAFMPTLWYYAGQFTPYVLTVVFTTIILWTMVRWWECADDDGGWRYLVLLAFLFGLDCSVHRTNALLMPGAFVWILLRKPRALFELRAVAGACAAMFAGLSLQLLVIVIARVSYSPLWNRPTTFAQLWDYVTIAQRGGGFLVQFLPRNSNIWTVQTKDMLHMVRDNLFTTHGPAGPLGLLAGCTVVMGLFVMWRRNRRLATAYALLAVVHAACTVLYFNIPADFFRSLDRHYLPIVTVLCVPIAYALGAAMHEIAVRTPATRRAIAIIPVLTLALFPASELWDNWRTHDASRMHFAGDFARNALESLPPRAILFTVGDNDTYPIIYMQYAEGVRRDVDVVNLSVANLPDFRANVLRREPDFPVSMDSLTREKLLSRPWSDTTFQIGIPLHPKPEFGASMTPGELVLLDIIATNAWKRPVAFAVTSGHVPAWLAAHARMEGLFWRVDPSLTTAPDASV
ncbi:MAG TPA: DUF2723 domain-containing protein, partial [Gemmatimonadaceae bacterium]|nr:DUF2723 domain-containing protein [Gemmatimonadaceae bacterium]